MITKDEIIAKLRFADNNNLINLDMKNKNKKQEKHTDSRNKKLLLSDVIKSVCVCGCREYYNSVISPTGKRCLSCRIIW